MDTPQGFFPKTLGLSNRTDDIVAQISDEDLLEMIDQSIIYNSSLVKGGDMLYAGGKAQGIRTIGAQQDDEDGFTNTIKEVNQSIIEQIVKKKKVPVIAPLGLDKNNQVFNINADTAAGAIAKKLNARRLIIMSDVEGVLDINKKLISEINTNEISELIRNETISGGMIPKIKNCLDVASNGVKGVCIIDGRLNHSILFELLSDKGSGTLIRL